MLIEVLMMRNENGSARFFVNVLTAPWNSKIWKPIYNQVIFVYVPKALKDLFSLFQLV